MFIVWAGELLIPFSMLVFSLPSQFKIQQVIYFDFTLTKMMFLNPKFPKPNFGKFGSISLKIKL